MGSHLPVSQNSLESALCRATTSQGMRVRAHTPPGRRAQAGRLAHRSAPPTHTQQADGPRPCAWLAPWLAFAPRAPRRRRLSRRDGCARRMAAGSLGCIESRMACGGHGVDDTRHGGTDAGSVWGHGLGRMRIFQLRPGRRCQARMRSAKRSKRSKCPRAYEQGAQAVHRLGSHFDTAHEWSDPTRNSVGESVGGRSVSASSKGRQRGAMPQWRPQEAATASPGSTSALRPQSMRRQQWASGHLQHPVPAPRLSLPAWLVVPISLNHGPVRPSYATLPCAVMQGFVVPAGTLNPVLRNACMLCRHTRASTTLRYLWSYSPLPRKHMIGALIKTATPPLRPVPVICAGAQSLVHPVAFPMICAPASTPFAMRCCWARSILASCRQAHRGPFGCIRH